MDQKGNSDIEIYQCSYTWTINNFKFCILNMVNKNLEQLMSPTFTLTAGKGNNLVWCLFLMIDKEEPNILKVFLKLLSSDNEIYANFKISIINDKEKETKTRNVDGHRFEPGTSKSTLGWKNFTDKITVLDEKNGFLSDGKLIIFCQVSVLGDILVQPTTMQFKEPDCHLSDDFGMIFENKKFSDVILSVADGREFQVHKNILAARSPVFAAMFEHEMVECKENRVNINDVDYEVMHEVLKFIYTGKAENLDTAAAEMLAVADKYDLERLKFLCEKELCTNLSLENATKMLTLSDIYISDI